MVKRRQNLIKVSIRDERCSGAPIDVKFQGVLRDEQAESVRQALRHDDGVLCAPTAFGKTVVSAKLIAERGVSTLVLVHRRQLLDQWRERLAVFLDLPAKAVGQIVGGKANRSGYIDAALLQSVQRKGEVKDFVAEYGHVIVDECHHVSALSFEQVMKQVKAKYVVGLTARNWQITADILEAVARGRTPLVLTHRTDDLEHLALGLSSIEHVVVLKGGMGKKQRRVVSEKLASIPDGVPRVILATGSYIGEGFDDSLSMTMWTVLSISRKNERHGSGDRLCGLGQGLGTQVRQ